MLQRIKSVLEVIWRRSCNIFETQTKERYYTPPNPPPTPRKHAICKSDKSRPLSAATKNVPVGHGDYPQGITWEATQCRISPEMLYVTETCTVAAKKIMLPILDKLCHNLADWTVWQFWDQIVTPILTIHASDLALWGRYNLSRLSALNPNNKKNKCGLGLVYHWSKTILHINYPLVNIQKTMVKITMLLMGKLTISMVISSFSLANWPFSRSIFMGPKFEKNNLTWKGSWWTSPERCCEGAPNSSQHDNGISAS